MDLNVSSQLFFHQLLEELFCSVHWAASRNHLDLKQIFCLLLLKSQPCACKPFCNFVEGIQSGLFPLTLSNPQLPLLVIEGFVRHSVHQAILWPILLRLLGSRYDVQAHSFCFCACSANLKLPVDARCHAV